MSLTLYNTLTRRKQPFDPIDRDHVRMYVCGPTVYDHAHIGNARPIIVFDVLYRLLRQLYPKVTYVRNITDVDDKINARAADEGVPISEVTARTTAQFHEDIAALGVLMPEDVAKDGTAHTFIEPRATDHVPQMIEMIEQLIAAKCAYEADGHVLFSVSSMADYGKLSKRSLDELLAGARVDVAPYKKDPMDFVLWKPSSPELPGWDSPWGRGRPGWHIECSAMAKAYLGEVFDIHGGGIDLVFPHHENEIAQSRCAHGTDLMAKVWMHNGYLQVEGKKMSKSEGNFVTIHELLSTENFGGRKWPGEVLRLAMLMTHYRQPIDWSVGRLKEAYGQLEHWRHVMSIQALSWQEGNREYYSKFTPSEDVVDALSDDLNTPAAIAEIHKLAKDCSANPNDIYLGHALYASLAFIGLISFDEMQRWDIYQEPTTVLGDLNVGQIERLKDSRNAARDKALKATDKASAAEHWTEADRIRDELDAMGIVLKDGPDGTTWEVKR